LSSARRKLRSSSNLNITDVYFIFASKDGGGFYKRVNASTDITSAFTRQSKKKEERIVDATAKGNSVSVDILFTPVWIIEIHSTSLPILFSVEKCENCVSREKCRYIYIKYIKQARYVHKILFQKRCYKSWKSEKQSKIHFCLWLA